MRELRSVPWRQFGPSRPALLMKSSSPHLAAQVPNVRGLLNVRIAFKVTQILGEEHSTFFFVAVIKYSVGKQRKRGKV